MLSTRQWIWRFLIILVCFVVPLPVHASSAPLVYVPIGDSIAEGWHATSENKSYIDVFTALIEKKGMNVVTKPGIRMAGEGLKTAAFPNLPTIIRSKPDLVTIEFGTNDSMKTKDTYAPPEQFKMLLWQLVEHLQNSPTHPTILLVTTWNRGKHSTVYDQIIIDIGNAKNIPVANIQSVWKNRTDTKGPSGKQTFNGTSDQWHPNNKGHQEIANIMYKAIQSYLK
ncbi:SGNH/GDSL hydrolase family protein [Radiobacillus deserti]|uniref:SGNH/GDSL hydrolase family protein n=1 Tax=Radiobacillus deserti TaxID=2594883 RepID=A0A516KJ81_9BACI|nr:SGNH/GDSL hydrolase family protein [Radiobacillus deserti]QDP41442.1 SGNH/GDSL hydrolase family protein [Radiobacillus deserti]